MLYQESGISLEWILWHTAQNSSSALKHSFLPSQWMFMVHSSLIGLSPGIGLNQRQQSDPRLSSSLMVACIQWLVIQKDKSLAPCLKIQKLWRAIADQELPVGLPEATVLTALQLTFCPCSILLHPPFLVVPTSNPQ